MGTPVATTPVHATEGRDVGQDSKVDEYKGRAKEAAGDLTNDDDLKREGKTEQASSTVKEKVDSAKRSIKDAVTSDDR